MPKKPSSPTPISSHTHADTRPNIPTEELRDFIAEDEKKPKTVLYPRDPSLDPQLVWKGKDEQDATDLGVPAVPVYIQEHIKPQAIVELVRAEAGKGQPSQPMLFADFNGLPFEDRVDFYHHDQHWSNRMILGDSLLVMTSLAEKEGLKGKVQSIYLDPPYGIKFGSNWQVSTRKNDVTDGKSEDATRQPEQIKAFRDTWQLGIHSYLSYLRDRLVVGRELLTESGSIFVQIGDENVHLVRSVLDEVFGSENFIALIRFRKKTMPLGGKFLERMGDFLIWYSKDIEAAESKYRQIKVKQDFSEDFHWNNYELPDVTRVKLTQAEIDSGVKPPVGAKQFRLVSLWPASFDPKAVFPVSFRGRDWLPPNGQCYPTSPENMQRLINADQIETEGNYLRKVLYSEGADYAKLTTDWSDTIGARDQQYVVETSTEVVKRCVLMTTDPGDLVLDPTCGSGTTAYVAEQWGRRWITVDTSRVSIALARTRLMSARYPYYLLADSYEGRKKEMGLNPAVMLSEAKHLAGGEETLRSAQGDTTGDIKRGFVYKRVPHVTLKSIANNEEIDVIHAKYQPRLEELRTQINTAAGKECQEWEIPRQTSEVFAKHPRNAVEEAETSEVSRLLADYWQTCRERQKEINASIARRADTEFLYDQPYEEPRRIRVAGPFTVESLSPHRVLAPDDPATAFREDALNTQDFAGMIIENLRASGVQNTIKNERLKFDRLEPYAGTWIHAAGEYTEFPSPEGEGPGPALSEVEGVRSRRVAVSIGPELGTVGPEQVKEAAKEAVMGVGFDLLIVCGFAFDPHVSEEAKRYGKLTVLPAHMNPDLAMGDELLKKTGAGNLFMVFGEPDLEIEKKDGKIAVHLKGLDVYDPTTGEIRSNSTDDIACWFIDTDYNEETFIVRHAYFTGADQPYEKLQRALRAEIDESAWSALYSTTSYPFEKPKSGKIAVKVINHYGDEVLKVYEV
ncbi:MAG: site-specific DNA-methyltransferase [Chloroflexi bacterium]|nr:site-specific DNA-methyltransferase [Chloroflexota bacterium]